MTVLLDDGHRAPDGPAEVTLPNTYVGEHVDHGYARTVDTAQGATVDHALFTPSASTSAERAYVALSRGRESNRIYATTDRAWQDAIGDPRAHTLATDQHPLAGRDHDSAADRLPDDLAARRAQLHHTLNPDHDRGDDHDRDEHDHSATLDHAPGESHPTPAAERTDDHHQRPHDGLDPRQLPDDLAARRAALHAQLSRRTRPPEHATDQAHRDDHKRAVSVGRADADAGHDPSPTRDRDQPDDRPDQSGEQQHHPARPTERDKHHQTTTRNHAEREPHRAAGAAERTDDNRDRSPDELHRRLPDDLAVRRAALHAQLRSRHAGRNESTTDAARHTDRDRTASVGRADADPGHDPSPTRDRNISDAGPDLNGEAQLQQFARDGDRDNMARDLSDDPTHDRDRAAGIGM